MTAHPAWCARPAYGCDGGHRSRPTVVDRSGVLVRTGLLARIGLVVVELVVVTPACTCAVELDPVDARIIGAGMTTHANR